MIAKGYPNKTIAAVFEMRPWTVGTHLRRIFAKLNVPSRAAMVARVMDAGLLAEGPVWPKGVGSSCRKTEAPDRVIILRNIDDAGVIARGRPQPALCRGLVEHRYPGAMVPCTRLRCFASPTYQHRSGIVAWR